MSYTQPLVVALDASLENESEKVAQQLGLRFMGNLEKIQKQYKTNKYEIYDIFLVLWSISKGSLIHIKTIKLSPRP